MRSVELRYADDYDAAEQEMAARGGRILCRLDGTTFLAQLEGPTRLEASRAAAGERAWMSLLVEAWRHVDELEPVAPPDVGAPPIVVAVVFVWPSTSLLSREQQRDLFVHAICNVRRTAPSRPIRFVVEQCDMDNPSWAEAKRATLARLGGHADTKGYAASLLECDPHTVYDASLVFFFAPYRLRRSHALIIREERHSFRQVPDPGGSMQRHVSMVRLATPEALARSG
jgi:hypothetical protein